VALEICKSTMANTKSNIGDNKKRIWFGTAWSSLAASCGQQGKGHLFPREWDRWGSWGPLAGPKA
jgi:hypothetical protein